MRLRRTQARMAVRQVVPGLVQLRSWRGSASSGCRRVRRSAPIPHRWLVRGAWRRSSCCVRRRCHAMPCGRRGPARPASPARNGQPLAPARRSHLRAAGRCRTGTMCRPWRGRPGQSQGLPSSARRCIGSCVLPCPRSADRSCGVPDVPRRSTHRRVAMMNRRKPADKTAAGPPASAGAAGPSALQRRRWPADTRNGVEGCTRDRSPGASGQRRLANGRTSSQARHTLNECWITET